jgi:hypothetical protein
MTVCTERHVCRRARSQPYAVIRTRARSRSRCLGLESNGAEDDGSASDIRSRELRVTLCRTAQRRSRCSAKVET